MYKVLEYLNGKLNFTSEQFELKPDAKIMYNALISDSYDDKLGKYDIYLTQYDHSGQWQIIESFNPLNLS